jgi:hypothetical protein
MLSICGRRVSASGVCVFFAPNFFFLLLAMGGVYQIGGAVDAFCP